MYRSIIKPILFSLTIERAHRAVLILLRAIGLIPGGRWLLRKCYAVEHPALEREVFGIKFANPVGLAAGFDRNGEAFRELAALGFGFVEVGTVTPRPQAGNPRPRVFRLPKDEAIINRIGLSNRGLEKTIQHLRRPHEGFIVGCNIGRNTATPAENAAADYLKLFRNLYQYADYFTVNISCDNSCREGATHTRAHILRILDPLFDFRRGQNQYRPIMLKVSPDMPDAVIDEISDILLETPLDGIVATNGTHNREGLHTSRTTLDKIGSAAHAAGRGGRAPHPHPFGRQFSDHRRGRHHDPRRRESNARRRSRPAAALHRLYLQRSRTGARHLPRPRRRRRSESRGGAGGSGKGGSGKNNGKARSTATPRRTHAPARRNGSGSRKRRKRRTGACGIPNSGAIRSRLRTAGVLSQKHRL